MLQSIGTVGAVLWWLGLVAWVLSCIMLQCWDFVALSVVLCWIEVVIWCKLPTLTDWRTAFFCLRIWHFGCKGDDEPWTFFFSLSWLTVCVVSIDLSAHYLFFILEAQQKRVHHWRDEAELTLYFTFIMLPQKESRIGLHLLSFASELLNLISLSFHHFIVFMR